MTADVIDVNPDTPGLDVMLAKFNIEHRHDEDEANTLLTDEDFSTLIRIMDLLAPLK